jgi:hypothetical protein
LLGVGGFGCKTGEDYLVKCGNYFAQAPLLDGFRHVIVQPPVHMVMVVVVVVVVVVIMMMMMMMMKIMTMTIMTMTIMEVVIFSCTYVHAFLLSDCTQT